MSESVEKRGAAFGPNRQLLRRVLALMALCGVAAFLLLIVRLYRLQIVEHELYEKLAEEQQLRAVAAASATGRGGCLPSAPRSRTSM